MTNSVTAILQSHKTPVSEWSPDMLDYNVEQSEHLYEKHAKVYLMMEDLKISVMILLLFALW
jgi:hypothetical protein